MNARPGPDLGFWRGMAVAFALSLAGYFVLAMALP